MGVVENSLTSSVDNACPDEPDRSLVVGSSRWCSWPRCREEPVAVVVLVVP